MVPLGVKIIAVLQIIGAGIAGIMGLLSLFGASMIGTLQNVPVLGMLGGAAIGIVGIVLIGLCVLGLLIGIGLFKGKNWARILTIVFASLGVLSGLLAVFSGNYNTIISLLGNAIIAGYLIFSKEVKKAFA